jgi:hypothetical protein
MGVHAGALVEQVSGLRFREPVLQAHVAVVLGSCKDAVIMSA